MRRKRQTPCRNMSTEDVSIGLEIGRLASKDCKVISKENERLHAHLYLLEAAISCGKIECRIPLRSMLETLTDRDEVTLLINSVNPGSPFYKSSPQVMQLVAVCNYWIQEKIILPGNSINELLTELTERKAVNNLIIKQYI